MAVTAAIALSSATATAPNGAVTATVTITNNNAGTATILGVVPTNPPSGTTNGSTGVITGMVPMGPGQVNTVAPSGGTLTKSWQIIAVAPQQGGPTPGCPSSEIYDIGCVVYTDQTGSDGAVSPSTTTLTVSAPTH